MKTFKEVEAFVDEFEKALLTVPRIAFTFDRKWSSNFPNQAGIYAIFDQDKLVYIGETADLKERMKDVKRTVNHTFRKKLGLKLYNAKLVNRKYDEKTEADLNEYYLTNLTFAYKSILFGRLETETQLINRNKDVLLNSVGKRGQSFFNYEP